ncbi:hypothetical protein RJ639_019396 [Escallonia herrerae]|uniref:PB1 domain-containing protein n=1 Tax=Escallonia herrerae TaxID=1293975 RepID=A0AA88V7B1_9ASTE|nr:hypothetical protein RJ639_019396 [Escallonia herrerae]
MKRLCRTVGISEWPSCKRKKVKPTHSNLKNLNESFQAIEERIPESSRKDPSCDNRRMQDATLVTIKATYADKIIRFQISSSSTMAELSVNLTERLPLMDGSFHIKYQDDEGDWVLLACEKDLQYCLGSLGSSATIEMRMGNIRNKQSMVQYRAPKRSKQKWRPWCLATVNNNLRVQTTEETK